MYEGTRDLLAPGVVGQPTDKGTKGVLRETDPRRGALSSSARGVSKERGKSISGSGDHGGAAADDD